MLLDFSNGNSYASVRPFVFFLFFLLITVLCRLQVRLFKLFEMLGHLVCDIVHTPNINR